jgi:hypothetical protein
MSTINPRSFLMEEPEERDFTVLAKGDYPFAIAEINAMTTTQKTGADMLPIKFEFTGHDGEKATVYENFVFTEAAAFKIKQFLKCVQVPIGQRVDFEDAKFLGWLKKQTGRARLGVERVQGKTKDYDKNKIEAFLYEKTSAAAGPPAAAPAAAAEDEDSEIPF